MPNQPQRDKQCTEQQLAQRKQRDKDLRAQRLASETADQKEARLRAGRERARARRQAGIALGNASGNTGLPIEELRRRNRERNAQRRANETPEEREARLRAVRERARARRQSEPPAKLQRRLEADRVAHQSRRATDIQPNITARQEFDRRSVQRRRELEDTPNREERLQANRAVMQELRAAEDTPTRDERRRANREAMEASIAAETTPEQSMRRAAVQQSMQRSRASQDTPTRNERQQANRDAMRETRRLENTPNREARLGTDREARRVSRRLFTDSENFFDAGPMNVECPFCKALHFASERIQRSTEARPLFAECCGQNKVSFPPLRDPPDLLRQLFTAQDSRAKQFRRHMRAYNNALCMASVTANWVARRPGSSNFNPTITIQGRIHHYFGPLLAAQTRSPAFLSVYIHDTDYAEQTRTRLGMSSELKEPVLSKLTRMFHECNPYVRTFRSLREWAHDDNCPTPYRMVIHADRRPAHEHVRRYNGPEESEVAALIPGNEDGAIARRDIMVRRRGVLKSNGNEVLDSISVSHRSYDALSYVLLFSDGRDGWHPELRLHQSRGSRVKVTPLMFYSWQLFERPTTEFSTILRACRLFQQYLVDQFCKVEAERLSYLRQNQQRLRAADYTHLREQLGDSGRGEDEADAVRAGRLFILPSTHIGSDRYMRQQMHDIIAISNKVGHPDIFLTMTCNPNWREILSALLPGQTPQDRPDLCARVFKLKLQGLMYTVIEKKIFGTVIAHFRVVEFQKRGLPHAHVIFFLDETSKHDFRNPENVDHIISAEIPAESEGDSELRELVLKHMIHTPCSDEFNNPTAPCRGESGCRKYFPKKFLNATGQTEDDYYVQYRRRSPVQGGELAERQVNMGRRRQTVMLDNSWVVPYNRKLLQMFTCHINTELCVSPVGGIKYLFKYVCKGSDRVTMELLQEDQRYNEIEMFQDARYVSASEAVWRLFSFNIVERNPNVVRLDVHLENDHTLVFEEGDEQAAIARSRPGTKLTEWFTGNQKFPTTRHILYQDYCRYFTWNNSTKSWNPRARLRRRNPTSEDDRYDFTGQGTNVVGRIYTVSPREGEGYFLRSLLIHKPGATSFEDLRTIDGEPSSSFRQACCRMGLLADDDEWRNALRESFRSSFLPLSQVFATILFHCNPSDPCTLWQQHQHMFRQDICARARGPHNRARREIVSDNDMATFYVLHEIQNSLQSMGSSSTLRDFELPEPPTDLPKLPGHDANMQEPAGRASQARSQHFENIVRTSLPLLNQEETRAFDTVVGSILPGVCVQNILRDSTSSNAVASSSAPTSTTNRFFFLDAPGETGKTFLINAIQSFLELRDTKVIPVATSAVAAGLLIGGRTAHSTFKIPIPALQDS